METLLKMAGIEKEAAITGSFSCKDFNKGEV